MLALCLALLPMSALADESADTSAIRMGLADISGYDATAAAYDYKMCIRDRSDVRLLEPFRFTKQPYSKVMAGLLPLSTL